jgi:phosphoglucosamine mutase
MSNSGLANYLEKNNINFIRTDVGDRNIIKKMRQNNFVLGGEPSGHIILSNKSSSGDGLLASLEVLYTLKETKKKLSSLHTLFKPVPQITKSYTVNKNNTAEKILKTLKAEILKLNEVPKSTNRVIIRKSGTENKIRVMIESRDKNFAKKIMLKTKNILRDLN